MSHATHTHILRALPWVTPHTTHTVCTAVRHATHNTYCVHCHESDRLAVHCSDYALHMSLYFLLMHCTSYCASVWGLALACVLAPIDAFCTCLFTCTCMCSCTRLLSGVMLLFDDYHCHSTAWHLPFSNLIFQSTCQWLFQSYIYFWGYKLWPKSVRHHNSVQRLLGQCTFGWSLLRTFPTCMHFIFPHVRVSFKIRGAECNRCISIAAAIRVEVQ